MTIKNKSAADKLWHSKLSFYYSKHYNNNLSFSSLSWNLPLVHSLSSPITSVYTPYSWLATSLLWCSVQSTFNSVSQKSLIAP